MQPTFPSTESVRQALGALKAVEIDALAARSGVPSSTLWKIRTGVTANPGIETVRKFMLHLQPAGQGAVQGEDAQPSAAGF